MAKGFSPRESILLRLIWESLSVYSQKVGDLSQNTLYNVSKFPLPQTANYCTSPYNEKIVECGKNTTKSKQSNCNKCHLSSPILVKGIVFKLTIKFWMCQNERLHPNNYLQVLQNNYKHTGYDNKHKINMAISFIDMHWINLYPELSFLPHLYLCQHLTVLQKSCKMAKFLK
jgi:hypothetical protein